MNFSGNYVRDMQQKLKELTPAHVLDIDFRLLTCCEG
jgi:hypothetical protein